MTTLSPVQIAQYAYNAGFRGVALAQSVVIALAESGGITNNVSSDGYGSHGLWQFIPSTWASVTNNSPFSKADDPQANADAAFKLYTSNGNSWGNGQWSTANDVNDPKQMAVGTAAASKIKGSTRVTAYKSTKWKGTPQGYAKFVTDWGLGSDAASKAPAAIQGVLIHKGSGLDPAGVAAFKKAYGFTGSSSDLDSFLSDYAANGPGGGGGTNTGLGSAADNLVTGAKDIPSLLTGWVKDFVSAILTPVLNFLIDLGMVAGGGALIFLGIFLLNREMAG